MTDLELQRNNLITMFEEAKQLCDIREALINKKEREDETEDLYWNIVDKYGIAMTELERYDKDFYEFCDQLLCNVNDIRAVLDNAIYCLTYCEIPKELS